METGAQTARDGLDFIVEHSDYVRKLASALDAAGPAALGIRKQIFELLAALCAHNEEGRIKALETLEHYKKIKGERYRLSFVVQELDQAKAVDYQTALVAFINCLIISTPKLVDRIRLRNEFIGCHLLPVLNNLRKNAEAEPDIAVQLDVFDEQRESDEAQYLQDSHGVDLNSPLDVFYAILKQVADTPKESTFLSILQHLLCIDSKEPTNDIIWDTAEKLVHQATLLEKREDVPRLLRTPSMQSKSFCHCQYKSESKTSTGKKSLLQHNLPQPLSSTRASPPPPIPGAVLPPPPPPPPPNIPVPPPVQPAKQPVSDQMFEKNTVLGPPIRKESINCKLPQQEIPAPKTKMKTINWNKIPSNKVIGKNNIWTQVACRHEHSPLADMNWSEMEGLFCQQSQPSTSSKVDYMDSVDERKRIRKETQEITLLDGKRSLNVNIFLKQFRSTNEDIIRLIKNGEYAEIGTEKLKGLIKILPEIDELDMLRSFNGDFTKLGNAEKFLIQLTNLSNYKLRIESMLLKEDFASNMNYLEPSINSMIVAAQDLMTNKPLQEVLYMVLIAGNFLNAGGYAGNAAGIKLSSFQKITDIRANKPNMSLIHYVALHAEKKNRLLLSFTENVGVLEDAAKTTVEQLNNEITALDARIKKAKKQIELPTTELEIKEQMTDFLKMAEKEVFNLQKELKKLDKVRKQLAEFFCEDLNSFKIEECFRIFHGFTCKFKQAVTENERRRIQEEQALARKKQREELLASKRRQMEYLGTSDEVSFIDLQIYDPKACYSKRSYKPHNGSEISEDDTSIKSSPSFSRKRLGSFNGSGAEYSNGKDEKSPDITPNGSIRRRRSRVLSEEDDGNLLDFLRGSGDNKRKSWGSLDRSWARKARGNSQRKRPALLGTDFLSERERASSPSPLTENKPICSASEEENNPKKWQQKIEYWLQANEQDQTKDEQRHQSRKLNNRKSIELDSESERSSALDTLPEGKQVYSGGQSSYRKEYPSWKPSATLNNMDVVGVIQTVEDVQPRVKDKSAWRKSTLNVANSTEETKENNPRGRHIMSSIRMPEELQSVHENNVRDERKDLIHSLSEKPATDKLTLYISKPSETLDVLGHEVSSKETINSGNVLHQICEPQNSMPSDNINKVEIDQDNIETPPATRKVFGSSINKREPVQPSPCKRMLGQINREDELDGIATGDGKFDRFSAARRTRRYKRNSENNETLSKDLPESHVRSSPTTDEVKCMDVKIRKPKITNNEQSAQENGGKFKRRLRNQTGINHSDVELALQLSNWKNKNILGDFISPACIKTEPSKPDNSSHKVKVYEKDEELEETSNLISEPYNLSSSLEVEPYKNNVNNLVNVDISKNQIFVPNSSMDTKDVGSTFGSSTAPLSSAGIPVIKSSPCETNQQQIVPKNSSLEKRISLSRIKNLDLDKKVTASNKSKNVKKNTEIQLKIHEVHRSSSRNNILNLHSSSATSVKTIKKLPVKAHNATMSNTKEELYKTSNIVPPNTTEKSNVKKKSSNTSTSIKKTKPQDMSFMKPTTSSATKMSSSLVKRNTSVKHKY